MLNAYRAHVAERAALGIPPLPLDAKQTAELIELIKAPAAGDEAFLLDMLTHRVPPGVDDAAKVKASFLAAVAPGAELTCTAEVVSGGRRVAFVEAGVTARVDGGDGERLVAGGITSLEEVLRVTRD